MTTIRNILFLLLLIPTGSVLAQIEGDTVSAIAGIEVETSVDKAEAYVGDLITYQVTIVFDSVYELIPPPLGANLGAFDVKDYEPDVETRLNDGRIQSRTTFVLSTFTTGDYTIPPLPIGFRMPDSTVKVLLGDALPINIISLLESESDTLDIRGLKAQYEFPRSYTPYYYWGGGGLLVIVLALLLWWWLRRRKEVDEQVDLRPPWEIAFEQLAFLKESDLLMKSEFKRYYIELTEIARTYLGRVYGIDVIDMTTEQAIEKFSEIDLPENSFDQFHAFLRHADLVKFARYVPEQERADQDFEFAHRLIDQVRVDYQRRQELEQKADKMSPGPPRPHQPQTGVTR